MDNNYKNLQQFFINNNKDIDISFLKSYESFGYQNYDEFICDFEMLLYLYKKKVLQDKETRLNQQDFREELKNKYKKCIITKSKAHCCACHIVPVKNNGDYLIDNGLYLTYNLHVLFDNFIWSINPRTLIVETKDTNDDELGDILNYKNTKVNIELNSILYNNLLWHYKKFKLYCDNEHND